MTHPTEAGPEERIAVRRELAEEMEQLHRAAGRALPDEHGDRHRAIATELSALLDRVSSDNETTVSSTEAGERERLADRLDEWAEYERREIAKPVVHICIDKQRVRDLTRAANLLRTEKKRTATTEAEKFAQLDKKYPKATTRERLHEILRSFLMAVMGDTWEIGPAMAMTAPHFEDQILDLLRTEPGGNIVRADDVIEAIRQECAEEQYDDRALNADWEGSLRLAVDTIHDNLTAEVSHLAVRLTAPYPRAIVEALGFDPTNHHNAAKCPYCTPAGTPVEEQEP